MKFEESIRLKVVLVSCENKIGLVNNLNNDGNEIAELPSDGLLGFMSRINPNVIFISSGGTYRLLKKANLNVISISKYTKHPEMRDGLVTSIDHKVHGGIMAQPFYNEDNLYIKNYGMLNVDAVITNFSPLKLEKVLTVNEFEGLRNRIDIGGPLMCMTARKAFINTLLLTNPSDYLDVIKELNGNDGLVSLGLRTRLLKEANKMLFEYNQSIDKFYENIDVNILVNSYK
ncbi:hypothetical protein KFD70_28270 [Bacillus pfraonensis]|uniref:hypothetical protein n=2 Tax=Bacillaceae TaxID=186817 RepID=UPI003012BA51